METEQGEAEEQTSDVPIARSLISSTEEGFSLTTSSCGAGRERTTSENEVSEAHGRSCADSDVSAEAPAVVTGSVWAFFSGRVIAPTSPLRRHSLSTARVGRGLLYTREALRAFAF